MSIPTFITNYTNKDEGLQYLRYNNYIFIFIFGITKFIGFTQWVELKNINTICLIKRFCEPVVYLCNNIVQYFLTVFDFKNRILNPVPVFKQKLGEFVSFFIIFFLRSVRVFVTQSYKSIFPYKPNCSEYTEIPWRIFLDVEYPPVSIDVCAAFPLICFSD